MPGRRCSSRSHLACLFTAETATHQWILFITAPAAWTTTPERSLIVCIRESETEVTNNTLCVHKNKAREFLGVAIFDSLILFRTDEIL